MPWSRWSQTCQNSLWLDRGLCIYLYRAAISVKQSLFSTAWQHEIRKPNKYRIKNTKGAFIYRTQFLHLSHLPERVHFQEIYYVLRIRCKKWLIPVTNYCSNLTADLKILSFGFHDCYAGLVKDDLLFPSIYFWSIN